MKLLYSYKIKGLNLIMSKHAYLIIANGEFNQLQFLLELLDDSRNDIYLLIDRKVEFNSDLKYRITQNVHLSRIYFYNNIIINWGDSSQITAEMYLFTTANQNGPYDYYHLLSGKDLPLHSQDYIHNFFDKNPNKLFLTIPSKEIYKKNNIPKRVIYKRKFIRFYERSNLNKYGKGIFKILEYINLITQIITGSANRRKETLPYIGYSSNWLSLNEESVKYLIDKRKRIYDLFHNTFLCDELFVPTILFENPKFKKMLYTDSTIHNLPNELQGNLRYINWWDGSPYTWTDNDLDKIQHARDLGHLFSRKFDLSASPNMKKFILKLCQN